MLIAALLIGVGLAAGGGSCSVSDLLTSPCQAQGPTFDISDQRINLPSGSPSQRNAGPYASGQNISQDAGAGSAPAVRPGFAAPTQPASEWGMFPVARCITDNGNSCTVMPYAEPETDDPAPDAPADEETTRPLTVEDLASFTPAAPTLTADPEGTGIRGTHTNIVATASAHTVTGDLFGSPVTVRFTPTAYTFDYGDGTTATHPTGGATWDALNQPAFTATDTSHIYRERGPVTATVTTGYTADVTFDGTTWYTVQGTLTTVPVAHQITIYDAVTALVDETCDENPTGPAC